MLIGLIYTGKGQIFERITLQTHCIEVSWGRATAEEDGADFDWAGFSLALDESCDGCDTIQLLIYRLSNQGGAGSHKLAGVTTETGVTYKSELNCFSSLHQRERIKWQTIHCTFGGKWDWRCDISYHWEPERAGRKWHARAFRWRQGDLRLAVDVTALMKELNAKLQFRGILYSAVKPFMWKFKLLSSQVKDNNLTQLATLKLTSPSHSHLRHAARFQCPCSSQQTGLFPLKP